MTESRLWILGAPDPEMAAIEGLLRECGELVEYATSDPDGHVRVTPAEAYRGVTMPAALRSAAGATWYQVECNLGGVRPYGDVGVLIDHHRPGDPGYGRSPAEFLAASSIGQVIAELARLGRLPEDWERGTVCDDEIGALVFEGDAGAGAPQDWWVVTQICDYDSEDGGAGDYDFTEGAKVPKDLVLIAAADHCLGAAYARECPGVDPDELMRWRAESRARFQGRPVEEVLADVKLARAALAEAPEVDLTPDRPEPLHGPDTPFVPRRSLVRDLREAYTVSTVLVAPFATGATVDANGVGDSTAIVFGPRDEGAWDEGGHHTFVRRGAPELPDAASREGVAYLAYVDHDGSGRPCRPKVVLGGRTTPEMVRAFLDHWAPAQGLVDAYGDPERGFAGAYLPEEVAS